MNFSENISLNKNISQELLKNLDNIFKKELPTFLESFEEREQQTQMAKDIFKNFINSTPTIIEAPTGVGKSLSYLIAALLYIKEVNPNSKCIVSTYTKTLQQQLLKKDLLILNKISKSLYGDELKSSVFFGSENYFCLSRYNEFKNETLTSYELLNILQIDECLNDIQSGYIEEINFVEQEVWDEINRQPDLCKQKYCKFYQQCFYYTNLKQIKKSNIIIVNHYLFFSTLINSEKIFGKNLDDSVIIFDEAHNLEEVIIQWLGSQVSNTQLKYLCKQIYNPKKNRGVILKLESLPENLKENTKNIILNLIASIGQFFSELNSKLPKETKELRIYEPNFIEDCITPQLAELLGVFMSAKNLVKSEEEYYKVNVYIKRIINFISILNFWLKCEEKKNYIYWIEKEETRKKNTKIILKITPLEIAEHMQKNIFSIYSKVVFTSATLSVNKEFNFFKKTVGLLPKMLPDIPTPQEFILSSPFNYMENVLLFLPDNVPNPKEEIENYKNTITEIISKLIDLTRGNTFVLFTSFELMNWVYNTINTNYEIILQNQSKYKTLEKYKKTKNSVLFGVDTFWQGIDIPGEKLISIIIPKLPFDVPDHPIIEAITQKIELEGGNAFLEYLLPNAIIKLKQGFGRLIRRKTDWGIISILDPRIKTKWYGKFFLETLPECPIANSFEKVEKFFNNKNSKV
ncbi:MAG: ATP-dependent DNA helicase [Endomicrobia bacterium]|nr:ATP-dependent DNA helicase [Endomicrobiia bacterium]